VLKEYSLDKKRLNKVCNDGDNGRVESRSSSSSSSSSCSSSSSSSRSDTSLSLIDRWFYHITSYITSRLRLPQQLSGQQQQEQQQDIRGTTHHCSNSINDHVDTLHGHHDNDDHDDCHKEHGCDITTTSSHSNSNLGYNKVDYRKHNDNQRNITAAIKCILLDGDDDLCILSMYHRISSNRHHDDDSDADNNGYHKIYNRYISITGDQKKINHTNDFNDVNDSRRSDGSYGGDSNGFIINKDERDLLANYSRIVASNGDR
jgi:hypothetical protein